MSYYDIDHEAEAFEQAVVSRWAEEKYKEEYKTKYGKEWPAEDPDAPFEL